jgi:hypothetical protein
MRTFPRGFDCYNRDRATLDQLLPQCGSAAKEYSIVDQATEDAIRSAAVKHQGRVAALRFDYIPEDPAIEFDLSNGFGLITPWYPLGVRVGGWVASFFRNSRPALVLSDGGVCVFPTGDLAATAVVLHANDRSNQSINIGDGLFWSVPRGRL